MAYSTLSHKNPAEMGHGVDKGSFERPQAAAPRTQLSTMEVELPLTGKFSTGMCNPCGSPGGWRLCLLGTLVPSWVMGLLVEQLEPNRVWRGGDFWAGCCVTKWAITATITIAYYLKVPVPLYLPLYYQVHRAVQKKYGLQSNACVDCLAAWLCPFCVACQDAREIMIREGMATSPTTPQWPSPRLP